MPPEDTHPRRAEFEGRACEVRHRDERRPGTVQAVYQPAPEAAPETKRVIVETEVGIIDTGHDSDAFEVLL